MQIDVRLCVLVGIELVVWLMASGSSYAKGRRLLCLALLVLALSPLSQIVLEVGSNVWRPIRVPDYAFLLRLPFYLRLLGAIVLLGAVVNTSAKASKSEKNG